MTLANDGLLNAKFYRYTYADATARAAASGFVPADVGVVALQLDNASLWLLTDDSPATWAQINPSGFANPMTTAGDLILGGSSGTPGRLAKGSDGDVLTVDPSTHLPVWAAPSGGGGPAGKLGYAEITSSVTTSSTSMVDATGLSSTVTIPSGGRDALITFHAPIFGITTAASVRLQVQIYDVTGSAILMIGYCNIVSGDFSSTFTLKARHSAPAAGSRTYKVQFMTESGAVTARIYADSNSPAFILVEGI